MFRGKANSSGASGGPGSVPTEDLCFAAGVALEQAPAARRRPARRVAASRSRSAKH